LRRRKARVGRTEKGVLEKNARPARVLGREAARPCVSKEAKLAKIVSLIVKDFCARPLKNLSIFAGFVRRAVASHYFPMPRHNAPWL